MLVTVDLDSIKATNKKISRKCFKKKAFPAA